MRMSFSAFTCTLGCTHVRFFVFDKLIDLRSKDKHFEVVLILMPDSTASRGFSKWTGPATMVEVLCPYSYVVDVAGTKRRFHANKLID